MIKIFCILYYIADIKSQHNIPNTPVNVHLSIKERQLRKQFPAKLWKRLLTDLLYYTNHMECARCFSLKQSCHVCAETINNSRLLQNEAAWKTRTYSSLIPHRRLDSCPLVDKMSVKESYKPSALEPSRPSHTTIMTTITAVEQVCPGRWRVKHRTFSLGLDLRIICQKVQTHKQYTINKHRFSSLYQ